MGAGRRTQTYDVDTRNETNYRFEQQQKNLGAQLGGVIFMCNTRTFQTCMQNMMFGLPSPHWCYVQYIREGMPLFLYNFESKELHGIFKAASDGEWELDAYGWTDGSRRTPYPCQAAVAVYLQCPPVHISQVRSILAENIIGNTDKFQQELTKKQAAELCAMFRRKRDGQGGSGNGGGQASWPGLGSGNTSGGRTSQAAAAPQFVPSAPPAATAWTGRAAGASSPNGVAAMDSEPAGPPAGPPSSKTFAQMEAEEQRKVQWTAKQAAVQGAAPPPVVVSYAAAGGGAPAEPAEPMQQQASAPDFQPSNGDGDGDRAGRPAAAAAAGPMQQQQQQQQAACRPVSQQQQQQQQQQQVMQQQQMMQQQQQVSQQAATSSQATAGVAAGAASSSSKQSGVELLGDELLAFKQTLRPVIDNLLSLKSESKVGVATALRDHLSRLDEQLMQVQKEAGKMLQEQERLGAQLSHVQQENSAMRQALMRGQGANNSSAASPAHPIGQVPPSAKPVAATPQGAAPAAAASGAAAVRADEIYLLGGNDQGNAAAADAGGWLSSVVVYSAASNSWREGPEMPLRRGYGCSGVLGHHLYVAGGGNLTNWLSDCRRLNLQTGAWEQAASMAVPRGCAGATTMGGRLYVAGGGVENEQYDTVEIYNPDINAWMPGPKLHSKRFSTAASALDGCVYVTGGYDGSYLQSAERLDPREGKWQLIGSMHDKRGAHACSPGPNGLLYVVGGYDVNARNPFMSSVEAFEPRMSSWVPVCAMQQGRAYSAAVCANGTLWVVGGMQGDNYNDSFERYDTASQRWVTVAAAMPPTVSTNRAFLTASVVPAV
ncbi:hypothetical protein D9Q98_008646 [Chlorella vulgaris]|uniref:DCD domain-containing protein n=1 Tax=Chlorella vulgaris TaxID=3077 RepID=A0A9D4YUA6_CHLVU|nr:hypothetical protein D9Q98_008646 [Chlorella vulgaris]